MSPRSKSPKSTFVGPAPAAVRRAERVVLLALLGIGEHVVRALHLLEARLGRGVARVLVRVHLADELAVRLLDLVLRRVLRDAEGLVEGARHRFAGLVRLGARAVAGRLGRAGADDDPRRSQHVVAEPVALLEHLDHRALVGARTAATSSASCVCGSNAAVRLDLDEALPRERVGERPVHEADAVLELAPLRASAAASSARSRSSRTGTSCFTSRSVARTCRSLLIARDPLAEVVELGLQPLERVEVLVALADRLDELVDAISSASPRRLSAAGREPRGPPIPFHLSASRTFASAVPLRRLGLFVDDLVVGVLDHLVVGRALRTVRRRRAWAAVACA